MTPWFAQLRKPTFTPPDRMLLLAWPILQILTAFAAARILALPRRVPLRTEALSLFALQLALGAVWPFLFFGRHNPHVSSSIPARVLCTSTPGQR